MKNKEFSEIGQQYEANKIAKVMASIMLNKLISKSERLEKMTDLFIQWKELLELNDSEIIDEIHSIRNITEDDINNLLLKRKV